jgi:hypothetical protein
MQVTYFFRLFWKNGNRAGTMMSVKLKNYLKIVQLLHKWLTLLGEGRKPLENPNFKLEKQNY